MTFGSDALRRRGRLVLWLGIAVVALGLLATAALLAYLAAGRNGTDAFPVVERETLYNVDDAGVGDLDGDGELERWTTNHSAAQRIWPEDARLVLHQDFGTPGMEPNAISTPRTRPARIHLDESAFIVETGPDGELAGELRVPWRTEVETSGSAEAEAEACAPEPDCTLIAFSAAAGGSVRMTPVPAPSDGFPVRFTLDPETDLADVQLGRLDVTPPDHAFTYHSKDRHGLAAAELDGRPALFVSRGGARGLLPEVRPEARDELLVWTGEGWVDEAAERGLEKAGCPGRQAAWVDVNDDGRLDIYQVCGRSGGANSVAPNRLYLQAEDGTFREAAAEFGLGLDGNGTFRFFRMEEGGLAALWATDEVVVLLEAGEEGFSELWRLPRDSFNDDNVAIADIDGDGRRDALIFSPRGNLALPLTRAAPEPIDLAALGLPAASTDGAVLDVDADGRADVFTVPQGVFLGTAEGYLRSDLVDVSWVPPQARIAWFDRDEDGDLDLWIMARGGAAWPRGVRGLFRRAPEAVQEAIGGLVGRHPVNARYWLSEIHENRLDHGRTERIPARPGEVVTVVTDGPGGERTERLSAGRYDVSRFSATLNDIYVTLPEGRRLVSATVDAP